MSQTGQEAILDNLRRSVESLHWNPGGHWVQYGIETSYSPSGAASKRAIVERMLQRAGGTVVWDLGANVGTYSTIAAGNGRQVIAFDQDASSVEHHWRTLTAEARASVLPLVMDLANPSPALGWALEERRSLIERGPADIVLALALVHHLAIGNNVPLDRVADLVARLGRWAIIEFVPKEDPMTRHLLAARKDVFPGYTLDGFRAAASERFRIVEEAAIEDSLRTLFLLERA
jgi:ribosomal protein L11 methylase PrmA